MILSFDKFFTQLTQGERSYRHPTVPIYHLEDINNILSDQFSSAKGLVVRLGVRLDEKFLSLFPHLNFVATITTGLNHIDEYYCQKKGLKLISLKGESQFLSDIHATPEHTWGLLLAISRNIPAAHFSVRGGKWDRSNFFGRELFGQKLGIVGLGRVGKIVAEYAQSFGMDVLAYEKDFIDEEKCFVTQVDLKTLLQSSDVISLHLPLDSSTVNFFDSEKFQWMKEEAILINTSRGEIIDESALLKALKEGKISGAALDVLCGEVDNEINENHELVSYARSHNNLIITPHIAGSTFRSMRLTAEFIWRKIQSHLDL
jgi:D-3-phosphoglycerate dehydrogenase / 2-oxoglutarate reductase